MFAWEKPSIKRINDARSLELDKIKKRAKIYSYVPFPFSFQYLIVEILNPSSSEE